MVIDTSSLICILSGEPEAEQAVDIAAVADLNQRTSRRLSLMRCYFGGVQDRHESAPNRLVRQIAAQPME